MSRAPVRDSPRSALHPALLCRGFVRSGGHVDGSLVTITSRGGVSPRARDDPRPAEAVRGGLPSPLQLHARFSATLRNDSPSFCTPAHTDSLYSRPSSGSADVAVQGPRGRRHGLVRLLWPSSADAAAAGGVGAHDPGADHTPASFPGLQLASAGQPAAVTTATGLLAGCCDPHGPPRRPVSERPAEGRGAFSLPSKHA